MNLALLLNQIPIVSGLAEAVWNEKFDWHLDLHMTSSKISIIWDEINAVVWPWTIFSVIAKFIFHCLLSTALSTAAKDNKEYLLARRLLWDNVTKQNYQETVTNLFCVIDKCKIMFRLHKFAFSLNPCHILPTENFSIRSRFSGLKLTESL